MSEIIVTNAQIVTPDQVIHGTVVIRDGLISEICTGRSAVSAALDFEGDYLLPGLIELHTDNLESPLPPYKGTPLRVGPSRFSSM